MRGVLDFSEHEAYFRFARSKSLPLVTHAERFGRVEIGYEHFSAAVSRGRHPDRIVRAVPVNGERLCYGRVVNYRVGADFAARELAVKRGGKQHFVVANSAVRGGNEHVGKLSVTPLIRLERDYDIVVFVVSVADNEFKIDYFVKLLLFGYDEEFDKLFVLGLAAEVDGSVEERLPRGKRSRNPEPRRFEIVIIGRFRTRFERDAVFRR